MTSSEEPSSRLLSAVTSGLERALANFACEPRSGEAKAAVVAALTNLVEVEARRIISENIKLEAKDGKVEISLGTPVTHLLRSILGAADWHNDYRWDCEITIPEWKPRAEQPMTRPYIDPRTKRPTRGHPM